MIDHSEYGAYIQISYVDDVCVETSDSLENVTFMLDTEQRFRNMLDEELSGDVWVAHAKDMHMWYSQWMSEKDTAGETGQFDEDGGPKCAACHAAKVEYMCFSYHSLW